MEHSTHFLKIGYDYYFSKGERVWLSSAPRRPLQRFLAYMTRHSSQWGGGLRLPVLSFSAELGIQQKLVPSTQPSVLYTHFFLLDFNKR